jgi:hypothetical protein
MFLQLLWDVPPSPYQLKVMINIRQNRNYISGILGAALLFAACGGDNTKSYVTTKGGDKSTKDKLLNTGADVLQSKSPLKAFNTYLNGFHFYNGNIKGQMEAHHYIAQLSNDVYQAIIFDGNKPDAKIMGIEYIITERLFRQLPEAEKLLWHSHLYEVKSGELVASGIPQAAEHELMEKLVSTYGKTIHTWHTDQNRTLPVGSPMLMMGFTTDGQLDPRLLADRDKRLDVNTAEKKKSRADIPSPKIKGGANAWQKGIIRQFIITNKADSAEHKHSPVNVNREE